MTFDDDLNACAAIVEKGDPHRFRTVMAAPPAARARLFPIYAFNVEVSRAPWVTSEPMIAEMRLQWWRDALEEIAAGTGIRRHEVVTPLAGILSREQANRLDELVAARRWDCYKDPFEDDAHLTRYLCNTSGLLMETACEAIGAKTNAAAQAGFALGVANWLRAVPELEAQKRIPLLDGTPDGVRAFADQGLKAWSAARGQIHRQVLPAFWPASGCRSVLKAAVARPERAAQGVLPKISRLTLPLNAMFNRW